MVARGWVVCELTEVFIYVRQVGVRDTVKLHYFFFIRVVPQQLELHVVYSSEVGCFKVTGCGDIPPLLHRLSIDT